ncbi:MAG: 4-hydroxy-3-methylbut-2-enyl diphosphate reductase, partial [Flavobacteriales bacterium]|nr:4-hydroxy-3-methylbut-2-enyl diphosphate reductase [Flavobacteriales bacterium]
VMVEKYGTGAIGTHFADTRDTLCYATNDNQDATYELLKADADLALVVGGYNSSNTSHLVELLAEKFPTYFINGDQEIVDAATIRHFDPSDQTRHTTTDWLPHGRPVTVILTSGASCPDTLLDKVMLKVLGLVDGAKDPEQVVHALLG